MGFGDKFKDLTKKAQEAAAENKEKLHEAVDAAAVVADRKTHGKYTQKIAKFTDKAGDSVDKLHTEEERAADGSAEPAAGSTEPPAAGEVEVEAAPSPPSAGEAA